MIEAQLPGEAFGTTEGLGREGSQLIDVLRLARPEEWLKQGVFEDAAVERVLESVQRLLTTCKLVERRHFSNDTDEVTGFGTASGEKCPANRYGGDIPILCRTSADVAHESSRS